MSLSKKDVDDIKLARPVSVMDLWDIDDRIDRLEDITSRLEKILEAFLQLYHEERAKSWEIILRKMLEKQQAKKGNYGNRTG